MAPATLSMLCVLPSLAGGGAERACINLCNAVTRRGWKVTLATVHGGGPLESLPDPAIDRFDLGARRVATGIVPLIRLARRLNPKVLLSTPAHLNLAVLLVRPMLPRGTRVFVREANTPSATLPGQPLPAVFRWAYRGLYPRADEVLAPSRRIAAELSDQLGVTDGKITVLPNPVDVAAVEAACLAPRRNPGPGVRLVAAGRLAAQKGFDRLIRGMKALPSTTQLDIFGDGPERSTLVDAIERGGLRDRVRVHGFRDDLWSWVAGADALVLSSRWEGMPNVVLEAFACGTRVVAMRGAGGVAELRPSVPEALVLVEDEAGLVHALGSVAVREPCAPRASLLAPEHHSAEVAERFEALARRHLSH